MTALRRFSVVALAFLLTLVSALPVSAGTIINPPILNDLVTGTAAVGDVLYADTTTTWARLADVADGSVLRSGGVGAAPVYGKVRLSGATTDITGTLAYGSGGTGATSYTENVIPKAGASAFADSSLTDDGTTVTSTVAIAAPQAVHAYQFAAGGNGATSGMGYANGHLVIDYGNVPALSWSVGGGIPSTKLPSAGLFGWTSAAYNDNSDTTVARAAAATPYFYGTSTAVGATVRLGNTNVGYEDIARNTEAHTLAAAGTSTTATAVWPANSSSLAASFRITTEVTGVTSVQVGVAGDTTRYGTFSTLTVGQTIAIGRIDNYAAETGVLFTAVGGGASFTAGVIRVNLRYVTASAPTS